MAQELKFPDSRSQEWGQVLDIRQKPADLTDAQGLIGPPQPGCCRPRPLSTPHPCPRAGEVQSLEYWGSRLGASITAVGSEASGDREAGSARRGHGRGLGPFSSPGQRGEVESQSHSVNISCVPLRPQRRIRHLPATMTSTDYSHSVVWKLRTRQKKCFA